LNHANILKNHYQSWSKMFNFFWSSSLST